MIRPTTAAAGFTLLVAVAQAAVAQAAPAGPRYVSLPIEISPVFAQAPMPAAAKETAKETAKGPAEAREAPETTASLKPAPEKPWCPTGRRVGTGVGFCLIN